MFWELLLDFVASPLKMLRRSIYRHPILTFRWLLFGGDAVMVLIFLLFQPSFRQKEYASWMAGLTFIMGCLFTFAIVSVRLHGYRRYRDPWLAAATALMFFFSGVLLLVNVFMK
ncbi:hypothetical protein [Tengunoibacter tsumagoiensis]|uniref:Uncharacterized protein n=1 Tax=Tengunoibacter tsumagoiensis TaxID=2014871 RepID=A0A402AAF6_9CHLR|nr:hypothetical protein [Tengunoibacter tsumagoiensis]GCE16153.1 hypothetical protein KTT_60120 [Tengunoibacter tsumagoiensis]